METVGNILLVQPNFGYLEDRASGKVGSEQKREWEREVGMETDCVTNHVGWVP